MQLSITVVPNAKHASIRADERGRLTVRVKEPAREYKANRAVIRAVAAYFHVAPSSVSLIRGASTKKKILELPG